MLTGEQRRLIEESIPLAYYAVRSFYPLAQARGMDREDVQQEALIGLCNAAQRFKPEFGFKFSTFAVKTIRLGVLQKIYRQCYVLKTRAGKSRPSLVWANSEIADGLRILDSIAQVSDDTDLYVGEFLQDAELTIQDKEIIALLLAGYRWDEIIRPGVTRSRIYKGIKCARQLYAQRNDIAK